MIELGNEHLRVEIYPEIGAGLGRLAFIHPGRGAVELLRRYAGSSGWFNDLGCYSLAPWSNRIARGRFEFEGRERVLRADWGDGTAIHGIVKNKQWKVLDRSPVSARLGYEYGGGEEWPWPMRAWVRYEVAGRALVSVLEVENTGGESFPAGAGFHPFWLRRLRDVAGMGLGGGAVVQVNVTGRYPAVRKLPTGPARDDEVSGQLRNGVAADALDLDDVFKGGGGSVTWPGSGLMVTSTSNAGHCVVYAPAVGHAMDCVVCVEPVTMANNAFSLAGAQEGHEASSAGVRVLQGGERLVLEWRAEISSVGLGVGTG